MEMKKMVAAEVAKVRNRKKASSSDYRTFQDVPELSWISLGELLVCGESG